MVNTVASIIRTVRELTFDRFLVPSVTLKEWQGYVVSVSNGVLVISNGVGADYVFVLSEYLTIQDLLDQFMVRGIIFSYGPYYSPNEPIQFVPTREPIPMTDNVTLMRKGFFSDQFYHELMRDYYGQVLWKQGVHHYTIDLEDIDDDLIGRLVYPNEQHLALWVAYKAVDKRRLYELAQENLSQSFSDGSDYTEGSTGGNAGSVTVNLGDVFTITENTGDLFLTEDFNRVGSDNVLGDKYSFWYRLSLWLRNKLEQEFQDFSFRPDNVLQGTTELSRSYDWRTYFDSFPFTLSPFTRGILRDGPNF